MLFSDRLEAGRELAAHLEHLRKEDVVVLGLPRGGVPVAAEVADALDAPLDVCPVRKLGVPYEPELGMGAIGEGGVRVIDPVITGTLHISKADIAAVEDRERAILERRARDYRGLRQPVDIAGRTVVVVDDGIATGSTARAACRMARARGAARVVLAVPVAPNDLAERLGNDADELVCPYLPIDFLAVGQFYADFTATTDDEVIAYLEQAAARRLSPVSRDREVEVEITGHRLGGHLSVPEDAVGMVVFAHGSGSSRHSPRNRFVATGLNQAGLGTLLFDLLTAEEEQDRENVFDTELLAQRLTGTIGWVRDQPECRGLPTACFGASTGAAAALWAAADPDVGIAAVVSRGGRPDLADPCLPDVTAPTLLIVGGDDHLVLDLNRAAQARLRCLNQLAVVPGATHLFTEPGALEEVTRLARDWFLANARIP